MNALSLQLKRVANIHSENIKVTDLVESYSGEQADYLKIKDIVVYVLPFEKRMINIQSNIVTRAIKQHQPTLEVIIPSTITAVRWEKKTLNEEVIKQEAQAFLEKEYSLSPKAKISFMNVPRVIVPNENVTLSYEVNRATENTNYLRLVGTVCLHTDKPISSGELRSPLSTFSLLVKIEDEQWVYQASRSIKKGETINPNDFLKVSVFINPVNVLLAELKYDDDLLANNFISKGSYLKKTDIISTPLVQINDLVTVLIKSGAVQLNYQAISRANGWTGDKIMLQNPDSKQMFYAEVIDKNKVLINLED
jgi:flagella basal body P-ring formation protein FlgA